jgi:hypothetical protein
MSLYLKMGGPSAELSDEVLRKALFEALSQLG